MTQLFTFMSVLLVVCTMVNLSSCETANLYFVEMELQYHGVAYQEFLQTWLEEIEFYFKEKESGKVKQIWKSVGERKMFIVMEKTPTELEVMMFSTPLMKKLGDQTKVTVNQVYPHAMFANTVKKLLSGVQKPSEADDESLPTKEGNAGSNYFWVEVNMNYRGHTREEFIQWLSQEIQALHEFKGRLIVAVWKCVAVRRLYFLAKTKSLESLDNVIYHLPLLKYNGENIELKIKAIRNINGFAQTLKAMIREQKGL